MSRMVATTAGHSVYLSGVCRAAVDPGRTLETAKQHRGPPSRKRDAGVRIWDSPLTAIAGTAGASILDQQVSARPDIWHASRLLRRFVSMTCPAWRSV